MASNIRSITDADTIRAEIAQGVDPLVASFGNVLYQIVRRAVREELNAASAGNDELMTAQHVREALDLPSVQSVYRLTRQKKLKATRVGDNTLRYKRADIQRLIDAQETHE